MKKLSSFLSSTVILSQLMHIFCCGLPFLFSVVSLFSLLGVSIALPTAFSGLHDVLHEWEVPVLMFSGVVVALGWVLHMISTALNCRESGACAHAPCEPRKDKSVLLLQCASMLFIVNCLTYLLFHESADVH